jgi:hypothetical protein
LDHFKTFIDPEIIFADYFDNGISNWKVMPLDWNPITDKYSISPNYALVFDGPDKEVSLEFMDNYSDVWIGLVYANFHDHSAPTRIEFENTDQKFGFIFHNQKNINNFYYYVGTREIQSIKKHDNRFYWVLFQFHDEKWTAYLGELEDSDHKLKPIFSEDGFPGFNKIIIHSNPGNWQGKLCLFDNFMILKAKPYMIDFYFPGKDIENWMKIGELYE